MLPSVVSIQENSTDFSVKKIKYFQKKVLSFYQRNKRKLPWRKTTDPYKILVSEFMLQQTQVSRVLSYYEHWTRRWPTIEALASASLPEVLQQWMGLGYNTRAVNLHRTAQIIVEKFDGDILKAMQQYKQIPGIGRYTSQAVQIFSTNADLVTVDTNIRRILIQEFSLPTKISDKELWKLAKDFLPQGNSRIWHNALMDYGALYLTTKKTGITPKTHQSRFEGSDRQIRARILRCLLKEKLHLSTLETTLGIERKRLKPILEKMISEGIIVQRDNIYQVNE
ncbi:MAG: A/G-specific adenine glycosylase [Candidatus Thermoplasmatota archaeon]|nr:A/G-specific adenine glycosylase [Candidatus Thermoplasmatota archaeon]